jgi:hypothetical protein
MKRPISTALFYWPIAATAQEKADTVLLKNGKSATGYLYKMEGGKIYMTYFKDTAVYATDQLKSLTFCHSMRNNGRCNGADTSSAMAATSANNIVTSFAKNCVAAPQNKQGIATVIFERKKCLGNFRLKLKRISDNGNQINLNMAATAFAPGFFYPGKISLGKYYYTYTDASINRTKECFEIATGAEKKLYYLQKCNP